VGYALYNWIWLLSTKLAHPVPKMNRNYINISQSQFFGVKMDPEILRNIQKWGWVKVGVPLDFFVGLIILTYFDPSPTWRNLTRNKFGKPDEQRK